VIHTVDPDKQVVRGRYALDLTVEPGETRQVALDTADLTTLGYWSLDAELQTAAGDAIDTLYDAAVVLVNNFDDTIDGVGFKSEPISFSAVADEERLLRGQTARIRLLIWNYAPEPRTITIRTTMRGLPPETRVARVPAGRRVEVVYLFGPLTESRPYPFFAYLFDENEKSIGSATKAVFVQDPAAEVRLRIDKNVYRPGESIQMSLDYSNTIRAAFDASFTVAITDQSGTTLFDQRFDETLRPRIPGARSFQFVLPLSVRYGAFKVWAEAATADRRLAYQEVFFTPALKGRVEGRVLNTITGEPAAGAQVQIDGGPPVAVASDTGGYSFTADAGGHWLNATAAGYSPARAYTVIAPERVAQIADIYVTPIAGSVRGFVVDAVSNEPITGARVTPDNAPAVTTRLDGAFAVDLPRGERGLTAETTGYVRGPRLGLQVYSSRVSEVSTLFLLPTQGQIRGVARRADTGAPLPGAEILSSQQVLATADADGAFALTFATGQRDIEVRAPGFGNSQLTVYIPAGRAVQVDDVLLVPRFGEVEGLIYDSADRAPIAGARVAATSGEVPPFVTGPDGRFHLRLRAQNQMLSVQAIGYGSTSIGVSVPAAKTLEGLDLGLVSLVGRVGGVVLSTADDRPISGARIFDATGAVSITGADGEFALTMPVRTNQLTIEAPGHQTLDMQADVFAGRTTRLEKVYLSSRQGRVTGRLIDSATGTPIAGGRVRAEAAEARTAADGTFEIVSAVGVPRVDAEAQGYQPIGDVRVEVHSGRASSVGDLPLAALAGVAAGRVQAVDGSGIPNVAVSADLRARDELPTAIIVRGKVVDHITGQPVGAARVQAANEPVCFSRANGEVELALPAGIYRVGVDAPAYRRFEYSLRVDAGFAARLDRMELTPVNGSVSGRVANAVTGQPIAQAKVWAQERADVWELTDAQGLYTLELPETEVTLRAAAAGHAGHNGMRLDLAAGHTIGAPDLLLTQTSAWVEGVVRNAVTGSPIAAALVWASDTEGTSTDANGSFRLRLVPGVRTINAMASGYRGQPQASVRLGEGTVARLDAHALFPDDAAIQGVVRNALDPQPLAGIRVWADSDLDSGVVTGSDGRFTLHVPPGTHRIQAQGAGYSGVAAADLFAYPGHTTVADLLHLVPAGSTAPAQGASVASGRLLDAITGKPIADTLVWWDNPDLALGVLQQEGNTGAPGAAPYLGTHAITGAAGWSDYRLSVSGLAGDTGGWGLLLRYVDEQNHYRFIWVDDPASGGPVRRLERVVAGQRTVLGEDAVSFQANRWTTIEAVAEGDLLSIAVGGRVAMQVRDTTHASGRVGLVCWSQARQLFREIRVTSAGAPLFEERHTSGMAAWTIVDAPGATPPSSWRMIAPTGVRTGVDGSFRLDGLPVGSRALFMDPQSAFMTASADNRLVTLTSYASRNADATFHVMPRACTFAGTLALSGSGTPMPGVRVRENRSGRTAVTESDGSFRMQLPAGDGSLNVFGYDIRGTLDGGQEVQLFGGLLTPGNQLLARTMLEPVKGGVAITLATAGAGEPLVGAEIFYADPELRRGGFSLLRDEGSRDGNLFVEGPSVLTGAPGWTDADIRFDVRCNAQSGWGALLRYQHRHSAYRLFYLAPADGGGGALITLARREGDHTTTLAETRRTHDPNHWYAVHFRASGTTLTVELDGVQLFQVEDTMLTAGRAGLIGWGSVGTTLRNVAVTGPDGTVGVQGLWDEEPGFGCVGGSPTQVTGTIAGPAAADVTFCRLGSFDYHFPVPAGDYRVELTFAEHVYQQAAKRRFQVVLNGQVVEPDLDLFATAGFRTAIQRSYAATQARRWLHLSVRPLVDNALVNYIRIWSGAQPVEGAQPLYAIRCGAPTDRPLHQATTEFGLITAGTPRSGGSVSAPPGTPAELVAALSTYLEGNMAYRFDLAAGPHAIELFFAEFTASTLGQRVFNVLVNGSVVVDSLDVAGVSGTRRMYRHTLTVQSDGASVDVSFQSVTGAAIVSAIRVDDPAAGGIFVDCGGPADRPWVDARGSSVRRLPITSALTDDSGTARFAGLQPATQDFRLASAVWTSIAGNDTLLSLPVSRGQSLELRSVVRPLTGVVSGLVLDGASGTPLADAEVWYDQRKGVTHTTADGRFRLEGVPAGWHDISVSATGFRALGNVTTQLQTMVEGGGVLDATIPMLPTSFTPPPVLNPAGQPVTTAADGTWLMKMPTGQRTITLQSAQIGGQRVISAAVYPSRRLQLDLQLGASGDAVLDGRVSLYNAGALGDTLRASWGDPLLSRGVLRQTSATSTGSANNWAPYRGTHAITGDLAWSDVRVTLQANSPDDDAWGVLFRYHDEQNYYRFFWLQNQSHGGPLRCLQRVQDGVFTTLVEDHAPYALNQWLGVRIDAAGSHLAVRVNDRVIYDVNDDVHATGRAGLYCWSQQGQRFRDIRVETIAGEPLFVESFTQGRAAWTVIDAPGATPPSAWEIVRPAGTPIAPDGAFRLDAIPPATQPIYALGAPIQTGSSDGRLLLLPARAGDHWKVDAQVAPATSELSAVLLDAVADKPLAGVRAWLPPNPRDVSISGADGRVALRLPAPNGFASPAVAALIAVLATDTTPSPAPRASLPPPTRSADSPKLRIASTDATISGSVSDAVSETRLAQIEVSTGDPNLARGSLRLTSTAWSGDPVGGVVRGPALVTDGELWSDVVVGARVLFNRPGGVALLARRQSLLSGYRAVAINDPDRNQTTVDTGSVTNDEVRFTRRVSGAAQVFSGTLEAGGTMSGTFTSAGSTLRFHARRRAPVGSGPVEGEWVLNANGSWLRLVLANADAGGFGGRCYDTNIGGTVARLERWSDGRRTVLAQVSGIDVATGQWTALRLHVTGNVVRLEANGLTVLQATDPHPLGPGRAGYEVIGAAETLLRDLEVQSSSGQTLFRGGFGRPLAGLTADPGWGVVGGSPARLDAVVDADDHALATHVRSGDDLLYTFGLPTGSYTVQLAFCEHKFTVKDARVFDVFVNDQLVDPAVDVFALVGARRLLLRRYLAQAGPAGVLIRLKARKDQAVINDVRVWPAAVDPDVDEPLLEIRAGIGDGDPSLFCATTGWGADGGSALQAPAGVRVAGVPTEDQPPLLSQRQSAFRYVFELPPGSYQPELLIAELQNPRQAGSRTFDIYVNGLPVASGLDVALMVGDGLLRLRPDAVAVGSDRLLTIEFVNRPSAAIINLIRVYRTGATTPVYEANAGGPTDRLWNAGAPASTIWDTRAPQGTTTDELGVFSITGVRGAVQPISLRGEGYLTLQSGGLTMSLPIAAGREYHLGLYANPATASLSGEVVDIVTGSPIPDAEIWYQGSTTRSRSDETGAFRIPDFPITRRDIFARAAGYVAPGSQDYVMSAQISAGQEGRYRLFLTPIFSAVEGRLSDAMSGAPIADARIWLGTQRRGIVTGADGRFLVTDFPAGQAVPIFGARDGYQSPGSGGHLLTLQTVSGRRAHFSAFLQPTYGVVQSKVLDMVTSAPIAGALVYVDGGDISTTTDRLGQFRLSIPAGDRRIYVESVGYISEAGHNPSLRLNVTPGKTTEFTLYLKSISGSVRGQVVDSVSLTPIPGALVYVDEGFSNTLTDDHGRYELAQSNREHSVYVKAVDYASDREDGWMASASVEPSRGVSFNHMLRPTLQLVAFAFTQTPDDVELIAGQDHVLSCRVRNTGKREGGALVRLIVAGFSEHENTEWIAPGEEAQFTFNVRMPADAISADHQEVVFELTGGERYRLFARVRGPAVTVEATLNKSIYAVGDDLVLRLRITNTTPGSFPIYTRAQIGDITTLSSQRTLTQTLEIEHVIAVDGGRGKVFFGVYLETGRALYLDAFYVPRADDLLSIVSDAQVYDMGSTVALAVALTESGRAAFAGAENVPLDLRLISDNGTEIEPFHTEQIPIDAPISVALSLPAHLRQGTYLVQWILGSGDRSTPGLYLLDVRGYKARFVEFLTDRRTYAHEDTLKLDILLEASHALTYRLDLELHDGENQKIAEASQPLELATGITSLPLTLAFVSGSAGYHQLQYILYALPPGEDPVLVTGAIQGLDVDGPTILAVNTDRRRYRPGDTVQVVITVRGDTTVLLRLRWDTGQVSLEEVVVLEDTRALAYSVIAPAEGAHRLEAALIGDTVSRLSAPALVRS
jgi:hypothetical protein